MQRPTRKARNRRVWGRPWLSGAPERIEEGGVEMEFGRSGNCGAPLPYGCPRPREKEYTRNANSAQHPAKRTSEATWQERHASMILIPVCV